MPSPRSLPSLLTLAVLVVAPRAHAQPSPGCAGQAACAEVGTFVATVTGFRTSAVGQARVVTFAVRFHNKTDRTLRLGYVQASGIVLDDQGNRYVIPGSAGVRAIGEITNYGFDPKFALEPGERSDARFEMVWSPERAGQIVGTTYEGDITVREIEPIAGGQFRLGREHALHFGALGGRGAVTQAETGAARPPNGSPAPVAPESDDPCAGRTRCYSAGAFTAEVVGVAPSIAGRHHVVRVDLKIQNRTTQPLILAYKASSGALVDELGNRYYWGRPGTHDQSAQGIGLVTSRQADPQFALRPGESRRATFSLVRFEAAKQRLGTSFTHDLALVQLEVLPSSQVRTVREHAVSIAGLGASGAANAADAVQRGKALIDQLRGRKRNP